MLTDKEKDILDKAEDIIKRKIEAMPNSFCSSDCKELQTLVSILDRIIRIRNVETPISISYAPEIDLNSGMHLASIERHG